jgi:hypothetical protein
MTLKIITISSARNLVPANLAYRRIRYNVADSSKLAPFQRKTHNRRP